LAPPLWKLSRLIFVKSSRAGGPALSNAGLFLWP
jgi:hypothetical protein